ncbi:MAG: Lrp/AsnC family transcriptional regulator [Candidatus Aenigmatarchaeota archaeon]
MKNLDEKDRKILENLKENSDLTTRQISKRTTIPITTVHNRIKKMEERGIIKKYTIIPDYKKLGKEIAAFILVEVEYPKSKEEFSQEHVAREIDKYGQVEQVSMVTGETDIVIKVRTESVDKLNYFLTKKLREIEGVDGTETMIVLKEI